MIRLPYYVQPFSPVSTRSRRRRRSRGLAATLAATHLALVCFAADAQQGRSPFTPASDDAVLQEVPAATNPNVVRIRALRAALDRAPRDPDTAHRLASAYIDFGRELGDAHYVGYAEAVIAPWLSKPTPPVPSLILQATILQYRHQFDPARALLKRAVRADGRSAQAWLTLATLDMVQGDYATAAGDCGRIAQSGDPILGAICGANLRSYLGSAAQSVAVLKAVAIQSRNAPASYAAWVEGLIAESAERLGDWSEAETHYRAALAAAPDDNFLLVAYGDFLLDRGRPQEVLALLSKYGQSDTAFLRIVLAEAALQSPDLPRDTFAMAARFEALAQRGDDLFGREQVRFALHVQRNAAAALALAVQNWKVQRAPWDVRVYLESALAANRPNAALPVLDFVDSTHLEDPVIGSMATKLRARLATPGGVAR